MNSRRALEYGLSIGRARSPSALIRTSPPRLATIHSLPVHTTPSGEPCCVQATRNDRPLEPMTGLELRAPDKPMRVTEIGCGVPRERGCAASDRETRSVLTARGTRTMGGMISSRLSFEQRGRDHQ
jgi:hypothetical protein